MQELIVSVRNASEAYIAAANGAAVLDVKEPAHGPLGYAGRTVIAEVVEKIDGKCLVSAAMGGLDQGNKPVPSGGLSFAKWGLEGCFGTPWCRLLRALKDRIAGIAPCCSVVPASYADWKRANAPPPSAVCDFVCEYGFSAMLIDTHTKDGKTSLDWLSPEQIGGLIEQCRLAGVKIALAGSLGKREITVLAPLQPDWFAVRGAVCQGNRRSESIVGSKVRSLAALLSGTSVTSRREN